MILAAILLASLNTKSAYQFVDVSNIDVTGDYQAATGERVRGEHVARFYEWLGEVRWFYEQCGGYVQSLHDLTLPATHEITANFTPAFTAINDLLAVNQSADVRIVDGDAINSTITCFSATYSGEQSTLTAREIAARAWANFGSSYIYPQSYTMPTIATGTPLTAEAINTMNNRSTALAYVWIAVGSDGGFALRDNGYTVQTQCGDTYYHGNPFWYTRNGDSYWENKLQKYEDPSLDGNLLHDNIIMGSGKYWNVTEGDFTIAYTANGTPTIHRNTTNRPQITGRTGVWIRGVYDAPPEIFLFFCCWKTGASSMNVKVIAKRYQVGYSSLSALATEVANATSMPSGEYQTTYVSVLFAAHGIIYWDTNATNFD